MPPAARLKAAAAVWTAAAAVWIAARMSDFDWLDVTRLQLSCGQREAWRPLPLPVVWKVSRRLPLACGPSGWQEPHKLVTCINFYALQTDVCISKVLDVFDCARLGFVQPRTAFLNTRPPRAPLLGVLDSVRFPLRLKLSSVFVRTVVEGSHMLRLRVFSFALHRSRPGSLLCSSAPLQGLPDTHMHTLFQLCLLAWGS